MVKNDTSDARLLQLPKVDLHVHLDGSVKPATVLELARRQGIALPADTAEGLLPYMQVSDDCESLTEYLSKFQFVLRFMQQAEAIERIAYELVEQAAQENVIYIEVRFGPHLHTQEGLLVEQAIEAALAGLARGEAEFGVVARLIVISMRHESEVVNAPVVAAAIRYRDAGVVAVDLAGDEAGFPASLFRGLFAPAKAADMPITIHAGEAAGAANIEEAIEHLGAKRLGHGVRLKEDGEVFRIVKNRGIPLEMCPISNMQTKAVSGWGVYPLRDYLRQGLKVTINTDNRTVSDSTLTKEYALLMAHCGLTIEEIARTVQFSVEAAFVDETARAALMAKLEQACRELGIALQA
ncbi:adenosine deaminase [Paenibacillus phyllosphaerae]|uniref:Adenosine deaminase n=1 Tax=Paenibacillus phyllosphaerae TaxID=274593 RepID=A0A7W5AXR1_9BACL|nr:adenosine deaminase [Paenibacillus phyllosphaerae]MBB3110662.1 adenosine deaminase [Paenibacillus phyllosphaerae]